MADLHCSICLKSNIQDPMKYCHDCKQAMCHNCVDCHRRCSSTSTHEFGDVIPQGLNIFVESNVIESKAKENCSVHGIPRSFYCNDHKVQICSYERECNHNKCLHVHNISELFADFENLTGTCAGKLNQFIESLAIVEEESKKNKIAVEKETDWIKRVENEVVCIKQDLREFEQKLESKFQNMAQRHQATAKEHEKRKKCLVAAIQELEKHKIYLNESKTGTSWFNSISGMKDQLQKYEHFDLDLMKGQGHTIALLRAEHSFEAEFDVSRTLQSLTQSVEILNSTYIEVQRGSIKSQQKETEPSNEEDVHLTRPKVVFRSTDKVTSPEIEEKESETKRKRVPSESLDYYMSLQTETEEDSVPDIPLQAERMLNVRIESDKETCGITGIADIPSGKIILADFLNFKIKLCDATGRVVQHIVLEKEPRDIAMAESNTALVTVPKAKRIRVVHIDESKSKTSPMTLGNKIHVNGLCCGIAYHDGQIYTATQNPTQIAVLNINGEVLNTIPGGNVFTRPTYVAVNPEGSTIFISDPNHKCVYGVSKQGSVKFEYKIAGPHGIARDNGKLFVADFDSMSVHLVSKEGVKTAKLPFQHCPQKVFYNTTTNRLLVTFWKSDTVKTYILKE